MNDKPIAELSPAGDLDTTIEQLAAVDPADAADLAEKIATELTTHLDPPAPPPSDAADPPGS